MESALRMAANMIRTGVGIVIGLTILAFYLSALTSDDGTIDTRNEALILIVVALLAAMLALPLLGMAVDTVCRFAEWRGLWTTTCKERLPLAPNGAMFI